LLHIDEATLKTVHGLWGPGKFSDILFMDGKAFRPDGNLVTYTGWGDIEYWNSFVANLEILEKGTFQIPG
jgi:hypothetical protein